MLYPLKFEPLYKDYIWGGRNMEKLGKKLPQGIVAESWEVSSHPDGLSIIANGPLKGMTLKEAVEKYREKLVGNSLPQRHLEKFPLLVKFIDANNDLSVQVHPDDDYARIHENGEYGKNEMWFIISAEPGSKLIYDVKEGTTKEDFEKAVREDAIERCLKTVEVFAGDVINIPSGLVHAIGKGILLAEIQQNSNTTYRVYDYNRVDSKGNRRPLHIEKALDVIDFNTAGRKEKYKGLGIELPGGLSKKYLVSNDYFTVELYELSGKVNEISDGNKFFIYTFFEGEGSLNYSNGTIPVKCGESVLIPASLGHYELHGNLKALKSYVPDSGTRQSIMRELRQAGYDDNSIYENVAGIKQKMTG